LWAGTNLRGQKPGAFSLHILTHGSFESGFFGVKPLGRTGFGARQLQNLNDLPVQRSIQHQLNPKAPPKVL
jgi:hypothetical protein